ncbi:MAG: hypothetical protein Q7V09_12260 [Hydrogenophaga sp.]|uniref:hypothetical protein n=1 Tax=Hydrogenophaga sp. TaxID=1904254 RepID=UPI0027216CB2|nr:hypothetical protein [Hydrogenophaga sp.]MDO9031202.1 hypothetical protein [Hydrogenophaga sp.]
MHHWMPSDPHWTTYLSAFAAPVLAVVAGWIAYRQYTTARAKLKLDLFEKRIAIYNEVNECLSYVFRNGDSSIENDQRFLEALHQAKWLFGADVVNYLQEVIWPKMGELHCLCANLEGMQDSQERNEKLKSRSQLKHWFVQKSKEGLDAGFRPYLSFDKWK